MTLEQLGLSDSVLEELANFLSRSSSEIKVSANFSLLISGMNYHVLFSLESRTSIVGFQNRVMHRLRKSN